MCSIVIYASKYLNTIPDNKSVDEEKLYQYQMMETDFLFPLITPITKAKTTTMGMVKLEIFSAASIDYKSTQNLVR